MLEINCSESTMAHQLDAFQPLRGFEAVSGELSNGSDLVRLKSQELLSKNSLV